MRYEPIEDLTDLLTEITIHFDLLGYSWSHPSIAIFLEEMRSRHGDQLVVVYAFWLPKEDLLLLRDRLCVEFSLKRLSMDWEHPRVVAFLENVSIRVGAKITRDSLPDRMWEMLRKKLSEEIKKTAK